ncbi:hypothetical protein FGO68_gene3716 [Halteria grandinella]|uniref:Uncharacterized protein n=1 Tax=Halteria grandinella TaxID=5974 RepID=A0A8J8NPU8_HALGN|nr:hypothetical protein FGO68_gene3716 [Halteria grandinella]
MRMPLYQCANIAAKQNQKMVNHQNLGLFKQQLKQDNIKGHGKSFLQKVEEYSAKIQSNTEKYDAFKIYNLENFRRSKQDLSSLADFISQSLMNWMVQKQKQLSSQEIFKYQNFGAPNRFQIR